jgi:hypothetical protein
MPSGRTATVLQVALFLFFMGGLLFTQLGYKILGDVVVRRTSRREKRAVRRHTERGRTSGKLLESFLGRLLDECREDFVKPRW